MPVAKYFRGHGEEVMEDMTDRYGREKGKRVFYATAHTRKQAEEDEGRLAKRAAAWLALMGKGKKGKRGK